MEKDLIKLFADGNFHWLEALLLVFFAIALIKNVISIILKIVDRFKPESRPCVYLVKLQEQVNQTNVDVARELATLRTQVQSITNELMNGMGFARRAKNERKKEDEELSGR